MKDESEPITHDEMLVRLVWEAHYKCELDDPVRQAAFDPKESETDGISVFRAACLNKPEDALAVMAEEKRDRYAIVLIPVSELSSVGLTVETAKIEGVPGHAVLPELNSLNFKQDKPHWREVEKKLAMLASQNIVKRPKN